VARTGAPLASRFSDKHGERGVSDDFLFFANQTQFRPAL